MMSVLTLRVVPSGETERVPFRCQEAVMGQLGHGGGFLNDASFLVWVMW